MISACNFSLNDVVVEVNNNVQGPIAVPVSRSNVPEEHDAGTNFEPENVGRKARWIEVVNEFKQIYVLLNHNVAALVDVFITRKLIYHVAVHHLGCIIGGCDDGSACQPLMVLVVDIMVVEDKV